MAASEQRIVLSGVSWELYEQVLAAKGEASRPRMTYLHGELELMSPSGEHEQIAKMLARLLETWADELDIDLNGYKSWTVRAKEQARGVEPDECYTIGAGKAVPDLAIEVIWTSGGIAKLEAYAGLGVGEVWLWQQGRIEIFVLRDGRYAAAPRSALLPGLDLALLLSFLDVDHQTPAARAYRQALRRG
jgi:Uma2 family endonuclease